MQLLPPYFAQLREPRLHGESHLSSISSHLAYDLLSRRARYTTPRPYLFVLPHLAALSTNPGLAGHGSLRSFSVAPVFGVLFDRLDHRRRCNYSTASNALRPQRFVNSLPQRCRAAADRLGSAVVNIILFQGFVLYTHYRREVADRRMYLMRAELKGRQARTPLRKPLTRSFSVQFRAKQKAQINERKTMDSKRRFSSYIFHEVRVPLNTACKSLSPPSCSWSNCLLTCRFRRSAGCSKPRVGERLRQGKRASSRVRCSRRFAADDVASAERTSSRQSHSLPSVTNALASRTSSTSLEWRKAASRRSLVPSPSTASCVRSWDPLSSTQRHGDSHSKRTSILGSTRWQRRLRTLQRSARGSSKRGRAW